MGAAPAAYSEAQIRSLIGTEPYAKMADLLPNLLAALRVRIGWKMDGTDYAAKTPQNLVSPIKGDVLKVATIGQVVLVGAAANLVTKIGTTAIVGLGAAGTDIVVTTLAVGATKIVEIDPVATSAAVKDGRITIESAGTTTSGSIQGYIELAPN